MAEKLLAIKHATNWKGNVMGSQKWEAFSEKDALEELDRHIYNHKCNASTYDPDFDGYSYLLGETTTQLLVWLKAYDFLRKVENNEVAFEEGEKFSWKITDEIYLKAAWGPHPMDDEQICIHLTGPFGAELKKETIPANADIVMQIVSRLLEGFDPSKQEKQEEGGYEEFHKPCLYGLLVIADLLVTFHGTYGDPGKVKYGELAFKTRYPTVEEKNTHRLQKEKKQKISLMREMIELVKAA